MPKTKGGKKLKDQIKQQKELEEQGLKNILLKKKRQSTNWWKNRQRNYKIY